MSGPTLFCISNFVAVKQYCQLYHHFYLNKHGQKALYSVYMCFPGKQNSTIFFRWCLHIFKHKKVEKGLYTINPNTTGLCWLLNSTGFCKIVTKSFDKENGNDTTTTILVKFVRITLHMCKNCLNLLSFQDSHPDPIIA